MQDDKNTYSLSYNTFLDDIQRFKKAGGPNTDSFNFFDSPSNKYYKIFFYFGTAAEIERYGIETVGKNELSGLLAPAWLYESEVLSTLADHEAVNPYLGNQVNTTYAFKPSEAPVKPKMFAKMGYYTTETRYADNYMDIKKILWNGNTRLLTEDQEQFIVAVLASDPRTAGYADWGDQNPYNSYYNSNTYGLGLNKYNTYSPRIKWHCAGLVSKEVLLEVFNNFDNNFDIKQDFGETYRTAYDQTKKIINDSATTQQKPFTVYKDANGNEIDFETYHDNYIGEYKANQINKGREAKYNSDMRNYNTAYANWEQQEAARKIAHTALMNEEITKLSVRQFTFASSNYVFNTAYNYLKLNGKVAIAAQLRSFIELLSNISIESPWYFTNIAGIDNALNRKSIDTRKIELDEKRKLTITCLPDAFDNRIGTLLDLYRSIVFDHINKRELIPANLRKFDMAIYIFEAPDQTWHKEDTKDIKKLGEQWVNAFDSSIASALRLEQLKDDATKQYASFDLLSEGFHPSFKLIEFHDCEFSYSSADSAWTKLDNQLGTAPIYTIDISYGDCYEISYNDLMQTVIGDIGTISDTAYYEAQYDYIKKRIDPEEKSWFKKLGTGLLQRVNNKALGMVKNMAYGNLYGFSLTDTLREIKNGIDNPMAAFDTIKKYVTNGKEIFNESVKQTKSISNVFKDNVHNSIGLNAFKAEYNSNNKNLGSIFKSTSIANNI